MISESINEFVYLFPKYTYFLIGIVSLCVGSLLNVIIYRLPLIIHREWRADCRVFLDLDEVEEKKIGLFLPRSHCPSCKMIIPSWFNIPILSYILLRGRCHKCKVHIPFRYPFVELLTLGLSLFAAWHFELSSSLLFVLPFIWLMICMIYIDLDHQILPDSLTLGLLWLGLIANTNGLFTPLSTAVLSAVVAYLSLWIFIKIFYLITGKIGMGNGDFKLFAAFGAWFGWVQLPLILVLSSLVGAIVGIIYLKIAAKNKDTPIPFGPFLCLGGFVSLLYGEKILNWYLSFYI